MPGGFSQSAFPASEPVAEEHAACNGTLVHSGMMEVSTLSSSQSLTYGLGLEMFLGLQLIFPLAVLVTNLLRQTLLTLDSGPS